MSQYNDEHIKVLQEEILHAQCLQKNWCENEASIQWSPATLILQTVSCNPHPATCILQPASSTLPFTLSGNTDPQP